MCGQPTEQITREHIWPDWFLKNMDALGPPSAPWAANGELLRDRDGQPIHPRARTRVLIPACEPCNNAMGKQFELPAKDVVRRLAANKWAGSASRKEWQAIGYWFAKVLLLLGHPQARYANPRIDPFTVRFDAQAPPPDCAWLSKAARPPVDLSVWIHNTALQETEPNHVMRVPRAAVSPDGTLAHCHELTLATPGACVTLLSHPGGTVDHPLVAQGHAWELLRSPPADGSDLSAMPSLSDRDVFWFRSRERPTGYTITDESNDPEWRLKELFGTDEI